MAYIQIARACSVAVLACLTFGTAIASPISKKANAVPSSHRNAVELNGLTEPLRILRDALKQKPRASRLQVNWFVMVLSADYNSTALYDRNQHTLIFDCRGRWDGGRMHERTVYSEVTDDVISRAAKAHENQMEMDPARLSFRAYFDALPAFGATLHSTKRQDGF